MKRSAPMMFSSQQRLQLKPKQTQQNADWDDIMPPSSVTMSSANDRPLLRRGAIFISNNSGGTSSNSNSSMIIPDSLLVQLITMNISKPSSTSSSPALAKTIPASASSNRTLFKKSRSRVHSRRKNRIAIVDNKIMMMKTTSSSSRSGSGSGG